MCRVYREKVEHFLEVLPTLYTILTLLPSVAVTHMTVGWKTNVATLHDLLNLTLTLLSILIFFSPNPSSWSSGWAVAGVGEIQVHSVNLRSNLL